MQYNLAVLYTILNFPRKINIVKVLFLRISASYVLFSNLLSIAYRILLLAILTIILSNVCFAEQSSFGDLTSLIGGAFNDYTLDADSVVYDVANGVVEAEGNIKIRAGKFNITANKVLYYKKQKLIQAYGGLIIKDEEGNEFSADFIELNKNNTSCILQIKARIHSKQNDFFITAKKMEIEGNSAYKMQNFAFTPCKICSSNFVKDTPLWQIKGKSAVMNLESGTIRYVNAYVEFLGVPIFYVPYLSMPSPVISRKSGFLIPSVSFSQIFGFRVSIPYYFNIAPNMDATLSVTSATKDNMLFQAEMRHLMDTGSYSIKGSIMKYDDQEGGIDSARSQSYRGHIEGLGEFTYKKSLSDYIHGFEINMLFDEKKTYLKRYDIKKSDILVNDLYWHWLSDDAYFSSRGLLFEDLRPGKHSYSPVNPFLMVGRNFRISENISMNFAGNLVNLLDDPDCSYQKLGTHSSLDFKKKLGDYFFRSSLALRGDFYNVSQKNSKNKLNVSAEALFELRREFWYSLHDIDFMFEPAGQIILSPYSDNQYAPDPDRRPMLEINSDNIFSSNHYYDLEQVELGNRINFGVRGNVMGETFSQVYFLLGGSYNISKKTEILDTSRSYISKVNLQLTDNATISNRTWLGIRDLNMIRNEVDISLSYEKWMLNCAYITNDERHDDMIYPREIHVDLWYNIYAPWWFNVFERSKLGGDASDDGSLIENGVGLKYKDECIEVIFGIKRNYVKLGDIEPSTSFSLSINAPF